MSEIYLAATFNDAAIRESLAEAQLMVRQALADDGVDVDALDWMDPSTFHVTVDFLGDVERYDVIVKAMRERAAEVDGYRTPLTIRGVNRFDGGALWIGVDGSMPLYRIRYAIRETMAELGLPPRPNDFGAYTPHLTLAFGLPDDVTPEQLATIVAPVIEIDDYAIAAWASPKVNGAYMENAIYRI